MSLGKANDIGGHHQNKDTAMVVKTGQKGAVRKRRKRQRSRSSPLSSLDETENGRRRVRRLPKIKGGELLEVTVLAGPRASNRVNQLRRARKNAPKPRATKSSICYRRLVII